MKEKVAEKKVKSVSSNNKKQVLMAHHCTLKENHLFIRKNTKIFSI